MIHIGIIKIDVYLEPPYIFSDMNNNQPDIVNDRGRPAKGFPNNL